MNWLFWLLLGWYVMNAIMTVAYVGKRREPISAGAGAVTVLIYAVLILLLVIGWPR